MMSYIQQYKILNQVLFFVYKYYKEVNTFMSIVLGKCKITKPGCRYGSTVDNNFFETIVNNQITKSGGKFLAVFVEFKKWFDIL